MRPSEAIGGSQIWPSEAIRGCQMRPSEAIRGHQRPSEAIRGNQRPSEAIRGHQVIFKEHENFKSANPSWVRPGFNYAPPPQYQQYQQYQQWQPQGGKGMGKGG